MSGGGGICYNSCSSQRAGGRLGSQAVRKIGEGDRKMATVKLNKFVEAMGVENLTPDIDLTAIKLTVPDVNRPALQLTGYFEHFDKERV